MLDPQSLLKNRANLPAIESSGSIPKIIFQTYHKKKKIPVDVFDNIKKFAPNYQHYILDDAEALDFLGTYFNPIVKQKFLKLTNGAHKADLLRYSLLYVYGGIYLDIKSELIRPMSEILTREDTIYTVISSQISPIPPHFSIFQGIIATPPRKLFFLKLIAFFFTIGNPSESEYLIFTYDFFNQVHRDLSAKAIAPFPPNHSFQGLQIGKENTFMLLQEQCSLDPKDCYDGLDRYGLCCFATLKGEKMIKIRRSSYPW